MTHIVEMNQPRDERGNDANDFRDDPEFLSKLSPTGNATDTSSSPWDHPAALDAMLSKQPPPIPWLARDRLQLGRSVLLTGIGGTSKTRMLYQLAIGTRIGHVPWEWDIDTQGNSVLVLTEDTHDDVHRTIDSITRGLSLTDAEIDAVVNGLTVYPLAGHDVKLLYRNEQGALRKGKIFEDLEQKIRDLDDIVFVGIDPALAVTEGDEMNQADQRELGKLVDDLAVHTGATVMLVSHATKGSQQSDEPTSHSSRGAGAITDAVRAEYVMRTMTVPEARQAGIADIEERKRHVQFVATKGNHLPPLAYVPIWLRRADHGVLLAADLSFDSSVEPSHKDMEALAILCELSKVATVKTEEWRRACIERHVIPSGSPGSEKKAMDRIRSRLLDAGKIERGLASGIYLPVSDA